MIKAKKLNSTSDWIIYVLTIALIVASIVFFICLVNAVSGQPLSYFPAKDLRKVFPEYAISYEDVDRIEIGKKNGSGEFVMNELTDEEAKAYLESFSEVKVNLRWTEAVEFYFNKRSYVLDGNSKIIFHLKNGETRELYLSQSGNPGRILLRINDSHYYVKKNSAAILRQETN